VAEALARLGVARPVLLGHSWGALVAMNVAMRNPASVAGLVLASGYYFPSLRVDAAMAAPVALPLLGDAMRYTVSALAARLALDRMARVMFAPLAVPEEFFGTLPRELLLRPGQIRAQAEDGAFMVPAAVALRARHGELRVPVHIVAGSADRVVDPEAQALRLHRELPLSRLHWVEGAGHMVHHAAPDLIADAVTSAAHRRDGATARDEPAGLHPIGRPAVAGAVRPRSDG
jgi:pimeloyl-ACP methyl ester carboxylesterase